MRIAVTALQQGIQILRREERGGGGRSRSNVGEPFHEQVIMRRSKGYDKADGLIRL